MKNRKLSMPFWCVANPVGDPFGPARSWTASFLGGSRPPVKAKEEKLIDFTSAHDDDLVAWDPKHLEDDHGSFQPRLQDPARPSRTSWTRRS